MNSDKIINITDYLDIGNTKIPDNKKPKKKKPIWQSFFKWLIASIAVACISTTVPYYLSPVHTNISIQRIGIDFGQIQANSKDKIYEIYFKDLCPPRVEIYLDNNNDSFIRITDIYVNIIQYNNITEKDIIYRPDIGGLGGIKPPIYLKAKIEPYAETTKAEIDLDLNLKYENNIISKADNYIEIGQKTSDKFFLTMNTTQQGCYSIEVVFYYKYHGKTHTIKTETIDYIFLEKPLESMRFDL